MKNKKEIVAVVPVREGSVRVDNKNFRPFIDGKSLLELKIEQLLESKLIDKIYISSDSEKARKIAEHYGVSFLLRDEKFCKDGPRNDEIISAIISSIPGDPHVAYVMVTNPFFKRFDEAIIAYLESNENDSLVAVNPRKEFFLDDEGRPFNYQFGPWHAFSQDLKVLHKVTGGMFIASKQTMQYLNYYIGIKPILFESSDIESFDIDEIEEFKIARLIAEKIEELHK